MSSGQKRIITNYTTLPNGVKMPFLGFGTAFGSWAYPDDELRGDFVTPDDCWAAIPKAVRSGYRRFDTALLYGTQKAMGIGLGKKL